MSLLAPGCSRASKPAATADAPEAQSRRETVTWGPIELALTFTPAAVSLDRDVMLDVQVKSPEHMEVVVPPLDDRLAGLSANGHYDSDPVTRDSVTTRTLHYKLTPSVAAEYRLAPFAVSYTDSRTQPPLAGWFPTRPIVLEVKPLVDGQPGATLAGDLAPLWIRPPFRVVAGYILLALLGVAALAFLWRTLRRVRREVALRRLSPRERALRELHELMAKGLIDHGLVKEFYVELTMIVRRYIERRHGVKAPEQTTEEFLQAVSQDARFGPDVLARLRQFLQAADMVKFAAQHPSGDAIHQAIDTAERYIQQDDATPSPAVDAGREAP